jgi:hypothetical protein
LKEIRELLTLLGQDIISLTTTEKNSKEIFQKISQTNHMKELFEFPLAQISEIENLKAYILNTQQQKIHLAYLIQHDSGILYALQDQQRYELSVHWDHFHSLMGDNVIFTDSVKTCDFFDFDSAIVVEDKLREKEKELHRIENQITQLQQKLVDLDELLDQIERFGKKYLLIWSTGELAE